MVYKLGQAVRPKFSKAKFVSIGLLGTLLVGTLATSYADSQGAHLFNYPLPMNKNAKTDTSSQPVSNKKATGSAHDAAASQAAPNATLPTAAALRTTVCTLFPPKNPGLSNALSAQLRKLSQYEQLCNGALFNRASFFVPTPTTIAEAQSQAQDVAKTLKEFATFGVKPLVFMEPTNENGDNLDLNQYRAGIYDGALDTFFAAIRSQGITDSSMGMWAILPEGNLPVWSSVDPAIYSAVVTKTIQFQKKYFPSSQATLLLDSETYAPGASWGNGHYVSLLPFIRTIPKGLVDSFGLQGFPWAPPANQGSDKVYDPKIFLRADFAAEAARALSITSIWFNTGSFNRMYTLDSKQTVTASPIERQTTLNGVLAQAKSLKTQGFSMAVHLFAEDKSTTPEAIDWSYWQTAPTNDANTAVFTTFVHDATVDDISLWLFDSDSH